MVIGANGMLGQDLLQSLADSGRVVAGLDRDRIDITVPDETDDAVAGYDVVVNCAAWTAVDAAEDHEAEAFAVNATGAGLLARSCARSGARLVQISTDYVFAGDATQPYDENAPLRPRSAYGRTKAAGEWAVRAETDDYLIVRTAWLYGAHGACFPKTIAKAAVERGALDVVDDQVGQPTWTADLAELVVRLVDANVPAGTYHGTSSGSASWHGFAREVVAAAGLDPSCVRPVDSAGFVRPAPRPSYSVLGHDALRRVGVEPIAEWSERWAIASERVLA
jgi:dTDP-4-dehydrorhamnose reductase